MKYFLPAVGAAFDSGSTYLTSIRGRGALSNKVQYFQHLCHHLRQCPLIGIACLVAQVSKGKYGQRVQLQDFSEGVNLA